MITYRPTNITIKNMEGLKDKMTQVDRAIRQSAYKAGRLLTKDLRQEMTKRNVSGRKYLVYVGVGGRKLQRPRLHTASKPSEMPAIITGEYRKSIDFKVQGSQRLIFGSGKDGLARGYAKKLEKRNEPIIKTVNKNNPKVIAILQNETNKILT